MIIVELNLTLERRWFDMIARGEKKEEYRDCENRQVQRAYLAALNNPAWGWCRDPVVIFRNGYTMKSRALCVDITGYDLRGKDDVKHPEWGEPRRRRLHLVVELGDIRARDSYAEVKQCVADMQKERRAT